MRQMGDARGGQIDPRELDSAIVENRSFMRRA